VTEHQHYIEVGGHRIPVEEDDRVPPGTFLLGAAPSLPEFADMQPIDGGGLRYGETDTHYIDLLPMLLGNVRVVLTPKSCPVVWDRGWCYQGMLAAYAAVLAWDPATQDRPVGWVKEAHTGERPNGEVY
jgi:hypothetical protein